MIDDIFEEIGKKFEINQDTSIEFKTLHGMTFVFKKKIICIRGQLSSAEIKPVGIIYDENGEYYFAPLEKSYPLDDIVEEYVSECI